jgi:glycosyltransferase involved in cell wall biosynthesis
VDIALGMIRAISFSTPLAAGTWSVFRSLCDGLKAYGIDLRWLAAGGSSQDAEAARVANQEGYPGCFINRNSFSEKELAQRFYEYVVAQGAGLVFHHVLCGTIESNLARYLPQQVRRILVVHNITPSTYRAARALRDCVHAVVGVSPRIRKDLVGRYGFPPNWTVAIPNGIDTQPFVQIQRIPSDGPLRILFHGRIEDISKGVLWVPGILRRAARLGAHFTLTVSGDGPDAERLRSALSNSGLAQVSFLGWTRHSDVPSLVAAHDVLMFPSRFEGLPIALVEAMAGGCVPVASKIWGVTDEVIEHGVNGFLFPVGEIGEAAKYIALLAADRTLLARMSGAARSSVCARFTREKQAIAYYHLIQRMLEDPRSIRKPLEFDRWKMAWGLKPSWWHVFPQPVKKFARLARERWTASHELRRRAHGEGRDL